MIKIDRNEAAAIEKSRVKKIFIFLGFPSADSRLD
jgi:hypothetical protein